MFLDNENHKLLLIIPRRIENMALSIYTAITLEKTKRIFFKFQNCSRIYLIQTKKFGYKNLTRLSRNCILSGGVF